ncbi:MFS transporter [Streptomyces morookaense]|uniref:MFS transporter n=1 Tax=Streptomyces morookaense TaxID=1970 RepID=UPI00199D3DB4|nr:MFS transporter [Streptomyces morookaense]GHF40198.1 MFS transporter [Streptomyces morookaense]
MPTPTPPPSAPHRRHLILGICCCSLLMVSLDNTVLNVALPDMKRDLHASVPSLQWTIDAYLIVLAALLMLSGSLADRFGRRRVFQIGLGLFTAGSLLCAAAPDQGWLVAFRIVQAVGGSMLNPVAMSIITNVFTEQRDRARAIGVWSTVQGVSMAAGPAIGGLLVDAAGWRSIFYINVPIGISALLLAARFVPESRAEHPRRVDPVGQLLVIALLGTLVYAIIEAPTAGPTSPGILGCATVAAAALVLLVWYEARHREPLIDPRLFRQPQFAGAVVAAIGAFAALGGFLFLTALYLQDARGFSALRTGVYLLPMAVMTIVCPPLSGRLVGSRGPRIPLLLSGTAVLACGLLSALRPVHAGAVSLFAGFVLFGIGFGLVNVPVTNAAVSGMPRAQAGVAAAVASTSRQVGQALGVAVIGAVYAQAQHSGAGQVAAFRPGWWVVAVCGALVLLVGAVATGRPRTEPAAEATLPTGARR